MYGRGLELAHRRGGESGVSMWPSQAACACSFAAPLLRPSAGLPAAARWLWPVGLG